MMDYINRGLYFVIWNQCVPIDLCFCFLVQVNCINVLSLVRSAVTFPFRLSPTPYSIVIMKEIKQTYESLVDEIISVQTSITMSVVE